MLHRGEKGLITLTLTTISLLGLPNTHPTVCILPAIVPTRRHQGSGRTSSAFNTSQGYLTPKLHRTMSISCSAQSSLHLLARPLPLVVPLFRAETCHSWAGSTGVLTPAISSLCVIRHLFTVYHWSFTTSRLSDRPQRSSTSPSRHGRRAIIYQLLVGVCHAHVNHVSISVNRSPGGTDLLATQLGVRSSSRESSRHGFP